MDEVVWCYYYYYYYYYYCRRFNSRGSYSPSHASGLARGMALNNHLRLVADASATDWAF